MALQLDNTNQTISPTIDGSVTVKGASSTEILATVLAHFNAAGGATSYVDDAGGGTWNQVVGGEIDTSESRFGSASLLLFSNAQHFVLNGSTNFRPTGTQDLTLQFWAQYNGATPSSRINLYSGPNRTGIYVGAIQFSSTTVQGFFRDSGSNLVYNTGTVGITMNADTWYHFAVVYDGTAGTASLFFNGNRVSGPTALSTNEVMSVICVDADYNTGTGPSVWFDDIRLSPSIDYSSATYTVPTSALSVTVAGVVPGGNMVTSPGVTGTGGDVDIVAGDGDGSGDGGNMTISAGDGGDGGDGGTVSIAAGNTLGGEATAAGHVTINAGDTGNGATPGDVILTAGSGGDGGDGGDIILRPGTGNNFGDVLIQDANANFTHFSFDTTYELFQVAAAGRGGRTVNGVLQGALSAFSTAGDAQTGQYVLKATTTDNTQTQLFLAGSYPISLPNDTSMRFEIHLIARRTDADGESAAWEIKGCIDRQTNAASTAIVGSVSYNVTADDSAGAWLVSVDAETTIGSLRIRVTGETSKTIRWVAFVRTVEVTG